jgi:hypothetical protein
VDLKLKITALTTEREAGGECRVQPTVATLSCLLTPFYALLLCSHYPTAETETRKMLESATSRLDRLEDFFMEENRLLVEENAHLLAHLEEAGAEIAQLRQEAARFEVRRGAYLANFRSRTDMTDRPRTAPMAPTATAQLTSRPLPPP